MPNFLISPLNSAEHFKAYTKSIEHYPEDLKFFLGEDQFFGIKKLIKNFQKGLKEGGARNVLNKFFKKFFN